MPDPLTGLPQRAAAYEWLTAAVAEGNRRVAVALVNVDGFAVVVESLGIRASDQVLREVAQRLREAADGAGALVARAGGDEFAVVLPSVADAEDAERIVSGLVTAVFGRSLSVRGQPLYLTASAGVAVSPPASADELLRRATVTVGSVKRLGGGRTSAFKPRRSVTLGNLALYAEMREALDRQQLAVFYQPMVDLDTSSVVGLEALLRWQHPRRGIVGPGEFLPPIADSQIIEDLGAWVLARACRDAAALLRRGSALDYVAVNVAPRQLSNRGFTDLVLASLHDAGLSPARLALEITEVDLVDDLSAAREALVQLRERGVRIAIDDFGTGYATLTSLRQLPVDLLKIDRTFVAGLGASDEDATIVASVASLAASIGIEAIAEGVETKAQAEAVRALGCKRAQGHLWSAAVPFAEVAGIIDRLGNRPRRVARSRQPDLCGPVESRRITELHRAGASAQTIAAALNSAGLRMKDGRRWHARQVTRVLDAVLLARQ